EAIGLMSQMFDSLHSIHNSDWKTKFYGQDFLSLEYVVLEGEIHFFVIVPAELASLVEKQITGYYPHAYIEQADEYNIFKNNPHTSSAALTVNTHFMFPIRTYHRLNSDPINKLTNALS